MTSNTHGAFVWIWLKDQAGPVVAGRLEDNEGKLTFNYGQSYLERDNAISIRDPELPLKAGRLDLLPRMNMPSCTRH